MPTPTISELRDEEELQPCVALLRAAFGTVAKEFGLTELNAPTNAAFTTIDNLRKHLLNGMWPVLSMVDSDDLRDPPL